MKIPLKNEIFHGCFGGLFTFVWFHFLLHCLFCSGSFARILVGEDMRSRSSERGVYTVGDDMFFDIFGDGNETSSALLNSVPSALSRWTVESRLLDGSSVHDCVNSLKPSIVRYLEKIQLEELKEKVAEEKRKKEEAEKKKNQQKKENSEEATNTATSNADSLAVSSVEVSTTSTVLTSTSNVTNTMTTDSHVATFDAEPMDLSPTRSIPVQRPPGLVSSSGLFATPATTIDPTSSELFVTPAVPVRIQTPAVSSHIIASRLWTPNSFSPQLVDTPSNYITPMNPLPDVAPNAPQREHQPQVGSTLLATPAEGPSTDSVRANAADLAYILGVVPDDLPTTETPYDVSRLNQLRNNTAALTDGLGFTPHPRNVIQTPSSGLPHANITPADVPSLAQLRSQSLFSQGSTPRLPNNSLPPLLRETLSWNHVPSPLAEVVSNNDDACVVTNATTATTDAAPISGTSALAADLATAIMSQLVTSSPTPTSGIAAQMVDGKYASISIPFVILYSYQNPNFITFFCNLFGLPIQQSLIIETMKI